MLLGQLGSEATQIGDKIVEGSKEFGDTTVAVVTNVFDLVSGTWY